MKRILKLALVYFIYTGAAQAATTYQLEGTLGLYDSTGSLITSTPTTGTFDFTGIKLNSVLSGTFQTGFLWGKIATGTLEIPLLQGNPVESQITMSWNALDIAGTLLLDFTSISMNELVFTTLDGDGDGLPGSIIGNGPKLSTSITLDGTFTVVPVPPALWLLASGLLGLLGFSRNNK